jgi:hypothetical protein
VIVKNATSVLSLLPPIAGTIDLKPADQINSEAMDRGKLARVGHTSSMPPV